MCFTLPSPSSLFYNFDGKDPTTKQGKATETEYQFLPKMKAFSCNLLPTKALMREVFEPLRKQKKNHYEMLLFSH